MGGYGSGRWGRAKSDVKALVEDCRVLDVTRLLRAGVVGPDRNGWGALRSGVGPGAASFYYEATGRSDSGTLRLLYQFPRVGAPPLALDYAVTLVTTVPAFGGLRWWFVCPGRQGGCPPCDRRAGKLYLPPGRPTFACRGCHDLAYRSSRESRRWDATYAGLAAVSGLSAGEVRSALGGGGDGLREHARFERIGRDLLSRAEELLGRQARREARRARAGGPEGSGG